MLLLSRTTLFKVLFVLLPLAVFSAPTSAADPRRANSTVTATTGDANEGVIEGSYIVLLKAPEAPRDGDLTQEEITRYVEEIAVDMAVRYRFELELIYSHALTGFSISAASETTVQRLMRDLRVDYVVQDRWVLLDPIESEDPPPPPSWAPPPWVPPGDILPDDALIPPPWTADDLYSGLPFHGVQHKAPWGLDRIDQRDLPLNGIYQYNTTAANVHVYVLDSGIRATHQEFGDRVLFGTNLVDDQPDGWGVWGHQFGMVDCNGRGTAVAGVIGGATYGVAKEARLIPVRIIDCEGKTTLSLVKAGFDWIASHVLNPSFNTLPAVVNVSFSISMKWNGDQHLPDYMELAVLKLASLGITVVGAAGDTNSVSAWHTPVITVSATNSEDQRRDEANYGKYVTMFAPGVDIRTAYYMSDTATVLASGTGIAAPHAAGVAALWYANDPSLKESTLRALMIDRATPGRLSNIGPDSPNLLLYSR